MESGSPVRDIFHTQVDVSDIPDFFYKNYRVLDDSNIVPVPTKNPPVQNNSGFFICSVCSSPCSFLNDSKEGYQCPKCYVKKMIPDRCVLCSGYNNCYCCGGSASNPLLLDADLLIVSCMREECITSLGYTMNLLNDNITCSCMEDKLKEITAGWITDLKNKIYKDAKIQPCKYRLTKDCIFPDGTVITAGGCLKHKLLEKYKTPKIGYINKCRC